MRGRDLEKRIEKWMTFINSSTWSIAVRLNVKQLRECRTYVSPQPCDYILFHEKEVWFIDAKETNASKWKPSIAPLHQIKSLEKAQSNGYKAGFLVWFRKLDPTGGNLRFIEDFSVPATIESGTKWNWLGL